jgi:hypothetical protein
MDHQNIDILERRGSTFIIEKPALRKELASR